MATITVNGVQHKWGDAAPIRHENICYLAGVDPETHYSFCSPKGTRGLVRLHRSARYTAREGQKYTTVRTAPTTTGEPNANI